MKFKVFYEFENIVENDFMFIIFMDNILIYVR